MHFIQFNYFWKLIHSQIREKETIFIFYAQRYVKHHILFILMVLYTDICISLLNIPPYQHQIKWVNWYKKNEQQQSTIQLEWLFNSSIALCTNTYIDIWSEQTLQTAKTFIFQHRNIRPHASGYHIIFLFLWVFFSLFFFA